jgi:lipoprotein-anchoring transpeptidase ErfK/SrfK
MKAIVSIFAVGSILMVASSFAADAPSQPLTRSDCDKAGMRWSEEANVCADRNSTAAPTQSSPAFAANIYRQPLTRADCDKAGMRWNEAANVCAGTASQPLTRADCDWASMRWNERANVCSESTLTIGQTEAKSKSAPGPKGSGILIAIDKTAQKMSVFIDGTKKYDWRVSTGRPGYSTPSGTYTATSMNEVWYSKEWDNAPMPHAIFFMTDGHAIHGTYEVKRLGKPASHGCVRIAPKNATTLYTLVAKNGLKNTQVVLTGVTPGGESNVASRTSPERIAAGKPKAARRGEVFSYAQAGPDPFPRRRGMFGRFFGRPSYGAQGYYRSTPTRGY